MARDEVRRLTAEDLAEIRIRRSNTELGRVLDEIDKAILQYYDRTQVWTRSVGPTSIHIYPRHYRNSYVHVHSSDPNVIEKVRADLDRRGIRYHDDGELYCDRLQPYGITITP